MHLNRLASLHEKWNNVAEKIPMLPLKIPMLLIRGSVISPNITQQLTQRLLYPGSSWFCEKLGRRQANAINQIPFILCGIVSAAAKFAASPELLMIGRFLAGLGAGAGCTYVPVYLTEIAPTKIRGEYGEFLLSWMGG